MREQLAQHLENLKANRALIIKQSIDAFDNGDIGRAMGLKIRLESTEDIITVMESANGDKKCSRCNGDGVSPRYGHYSLPYEEWEWDICECILYRRVSEREE